ncbi:MAG: hypothetical protein ACYDAQ_05340 [Mycobacteriales bacterium]
MDSPSNEAVPSRSTSHDLLEVCLISGDSNRVVEVLKAMVRTFADLLTQGLISANPRSKVQVRDRRDSHVLIEYDYGRDLNGAAEHVRQLNERLDRETPSEFLRELGLGEAFFR